MLFGPAAIELTEQIARAIIQPKVQKQKPLRLSAKS
jgi:hypothetical protein